MVEYRVDSRTNEPKFMEINPRFWGSLQTAVFSGIDFPYLLYKLGIENECKDSFEYEAGKQVRWLFFGDILWFINSKKSLKDFFIFTRNGLSYDIFSCSDLGPVYGVIREALSSIFKTERRKHVFKRGWKT